MVIILPVFIDIIYPFNLFKVWQMAENIYNDEEIDTPASEVEDK